MMSIYCLFEAGHQNTQGITIIQHLKQHNNYNAGHHDFAGLTVSAGMSSLRLAHDHEDSSVGFHEYKQIERAHASVPCCGQ